MKSNQLTDFALKVDDDAGANSASGAFVVVYIVVGVLSLPAIVIVAMLVGKSLISSVITALLLAAPVSVATVLILRAFSHP